MFLKTVFISVCAIIAVITLYTTPHAESADCNLCHKELSSKKNVHGAIYMGCVSCHTNIDARNIPHAVATSVPKGLSSPQPDICYGCHDRSLFDGHKVVHTPVGAGMCTSCHSPHSSDNEKLLTVEMPELCYTCHDRAKLTGKVMHKPAQVGLCVTCHAPHQADNERLLIKTVPDLCYNCHSNEDFLRRNVHVPVAGGACLNCHNPHASPATGLLPKSPVAVCLDCHPKVSRAHVLAVSMGHPVGLTKKRGKSIKDPNRKGKIFYCVSCHEPHSSDWNKLFRYRANSTFELCINCHEK